MPEQKPTTATDNRWESLIAAVKEYAERDRIVRNVPGMEGLTEGVFAAWFIEDELPEQLSGPFFKVTDVEDEGGWRVDGNGDVIGICRVYLKLPLEYVVEILIKDMMIDGLAADDERLQKIRKCWDAIIDNPKDAPPEAKARMQSIADVMNHMSERFDKEGAALRTFREKYKRFENAVRDYANEYHYDLPAAVLDEKKVCLNDWYAFFSEIKGAAPTSGEQAKALRQIEKLKAALG